MPYPGATVDVLIANNVVHHLATPPLIFAEAVRVLAPADICCCRSATACWPRGLAIRFTAGARRPRP